MINNKAKEFTIGWIYKIQNKTNGKVYIGQTINKDTRPLEHFTKKTNKRFQNSIEKHGRYGFEISYLCECYSREDLDWAEIFYIVEWYDSTFYRNGYNLRTEMQGDSNHFKNYTPSEYQAFRDKLKISFNKPETILKKSLAAIKASSNEDYKRRIKILRNSDVNYRKEN